MAWRLVPGALLGWLLGWVLILSAPMVPMRVVLVAGAGAACAALLAVRRWRAVAATLAIVAAVLFSTALYLSGLTAEPIRDHLGRAVVAHVVIVGDLRAQQAGPWGGEPTLTARAHLSSLRVGDRAWEVGAPVLLRLSPGEARPIGALLRVSGTLRDGDLVRGYAAELTATQVDVIAGPGPLAAMSAAVRESLHRALAGGRPEAAALVAGLAVGDETLQPPELAADMRVAGLSHLTAVSGGNTALVVGATLAVSALFGAGLMLRVGLAGLALGLFVVVVGPQPSVLRAAVMGVIALIALITGGQRQALAALSIAVVLLLVLSPGLAASWGFALSVWATAGLVLLAAPLAQRLPLLSPRSRALTHALALTMAAQIATAPLIAAFGDGLSLVAVPANLAAAPAVGPVTVLGLLAAVSGLVWPALGTFFARLAEPPAAWIALVARVSADAPLATLPWPGGWHGALLAFALAGWLVWWIRRHRGRHERSVRQRTAVLVAVVAGLIAIVGLRLPDRAGWPPPGWIMVACDVGQGDALVLRGDSGRTVVVDTGPDPQLMERCLSDLGVEHVGLLVLTHPHIDHVGGVPAVLDGRAVDAALVSPVREPLDQVRRIEDWLAGIPVATAMVGEVRDVDGVRIETLWPQRIIRGSESVANNASVVLLVQVQGIRILLFADVETAAQVALRSSFLVEGVDVVKIPHHGSRLQDPALAAWTGGRIAVVSVGADNSYGHPARETLAQWASAGAVIARTDQAGDIAIVADPSLGVVTRRESNVPLESSLSVGAGG